MAFIEITYYIRHVYNIYDPDYIQDKRLTFRHTIDQRFERINARH